MTREDKSAQKQTASSFQSSNHLVPKLYSSGPKPVLPYCVFSAWKTLFLKLDDFFLLGWQNGYFQLIALKQCYLNLGFKKHCLTCTLIKGSVFYMYYEVVIKKKILKGLHKLPLWVQKKFAVLAKDLQDTGPEQKKWQNYSKLSPTEYHCPIGMSWIACWHHDKQTIIIEVYYVGSREKSPY